MIDTAERRKKRAQILRQARLDAGYSSAAKAARALGMKEAAYTHHENGTRGISNEAAMLYGRKFKVDPGALVGLTENGRGNEVAVMGDVALGIWRDKAIDTELNMNKRSLEVPNTTGDSVRYAVRIVDDSVNKVMPANDYAICVFVTDEQLVMGSFVDIEYIRGQLVERTIRHVERDKAGTIRLCTYSTHKSLTSSVAYPPKGRDEKVEIIGRVIGKYSEIAPMA